MLRLTKLRTSFQQIAKQHYSSTPHRWYTGAVRGLLKFAGRLATDNTAGKYAVNKNSHTLSRESLELIGRRAKIRAIKIAHETRYVQFYPPANL